MKYTIYSMADGRVLQQVDCPPDLVALQCPPGAAWLDGASDPDCHYIAAGQRCPRPALTLPESLAASVGAVVTIAPLPTPADVEFEHLGRWQVDTGQLQVTLTTAGSYRLFIDAFPALRHTIHIEVT